MTGEALSWADQWGPGGIGAGDDDYSRTGEVGHNRKNKSKVAFEKAKAAASSGAQKIKLGTSSSFKWIKDQCQKKGSSK
ncbi:hypothetical protein MLD38_019406 [Melastoma candidum]|uniref:Uncharacterized protein n=1 Tax=Melastoma candidum TaxID=119954 RepID=A0ACB9QWZ8_9MYRT|nr:hypothetical protein MLD38_019406 [Melastoma candidum]